MRHSASAEPASRPKRRITDRSTHHDWPPRMNQHTFPEGRSAHCPCGGATPGRAAPATAPRYEDCCGRSIDAGMPAPNAWELMRSRYTAYVLGAVAYLRA